MRADNRTSVQPNLLALTLPASSFVEFTAKKLANPKLKWAGPCLSVAEKSSWREFAYCIPMPSECKNVYRAKQRELLAERYGGWGVGVNGGGVRCGLYGSMQIKGVGKNPLAGHPQDFWHTYGGAALEEGIQEAIWGEVCDIALPFGATRVKAIITTGSTVPYRNFTGEKVAQRVLILRDFTLRPAHYMRSIFYGTSLSEEGIYPCDAARTSQAINSMYPIPHTSPTTVEDERHRANRINDLLSEMCRRFSFQFAAARAKRIMHGTITPSNIGIDGRWIDFGTISTVSDYGKIKFGTNLSPDMSAEYKSINQWLDELIFYICKYSTKSTAERLITSNELVKNYEVQYGNRLNIEMLKLTGVPEESLERIDRHLVERFGRTINSVLKAARFKQFKLDYPSAWKMPASMGDIHLNFILILAALCSTLEQMLAVTKSCISDDKLRIEFCTSYCGLKEAYLFGVGDKEKNHGETYLMLNALRRNVPFTDLYRTNFENSISDTIAKGRPIAKYVQNIVGLAVTQLAEPVSGVIDLDAWFKNVKVDSVHGLTKNNRPIKLRNLAFNPGVSLLTQNQMELFKSHAQYLDR